MHFNYFCRIKCLKENSEKLNEVKRIKIPAIEAARDIILSAYNEKGKELMDFAESLITKRTSLKWRIT